MGRGFKCTLPNLINWETISRLGDGWREWKKRSNTKLDANHHVKIIYSYLCMFMLRNDDDFSFLLLTKKFAPKCSFPFRSFIKNAISKILKNDLIRFTFYYHCRFLTNLANHEIIKKIVLKPRNCSKMNTGPKIVPSKPAVKDCKIS